MFGLAQQIDRTQLCIDGIIRNHQSFGWPGKQIDPDAAVELPLGLGDKHVTRADQHVDRRDALGTQRHRCNGLYTAEYQDLIGTAVVHGGDNRRVWTTLMWRCSRCNVFYASHFGRHDAHVCGGDHRILATRHVTADAVHWNIAVSQYNTRQGFDFKIVQARFLFLREIADLGLGKLNIRKVLCWYLVYCSLNFFCTQAKRGRTPGIKFFRQFPNRIVTAQFYVCQNAFNRGSDFCITLSDLGGAFTLFQIPYHRSFLLFAEAVVSVCERNRSRFFP